jgi:hypothetical protein
MGIVPIVRRARPEVVGKRLPNLSMRRPPQKEETVIPADIAVSMSPMCNGDCSLLESSKGIEINNEYMARLLNPIPTAAALNDFL